VCQGGKIVDVNKFSWVLGSREIMESEKKLKLVSLLKLQSPSAGNLSVAQFSLDCIDNDADNDDNDLDVNCETFVSVVSECDKLVISDSEMQVLVFVAGYIGRKLRTLLCCNDCIGEYVSDEEMNCDVSSTDLVYLHSLDRGGLCWPTQMLVDIIVIVFLIFKRLVSSDHEDKFIHLTNHKAVLMQLSVKGIIEQCNVSDVCECGRDYFCVVKLSVRKMSNILLNNYMKQLNDKRTGGKINEKSKASRKLKTLSDAT
jgi:hypothetical protein